MKSTKPKYVEIDHGETKIWIASALMETLERVHSWIFPEKRKLVELRELPAGTYYDPLTQWSPNAFVFGKNGRRLTKK